MGKIVKKTQELQEKQQTAMKSKLEPILKKAFAWHDKNGTGVLEVDESIVFFSNYASFLPSFGKDITKMSGMQAAKQMGDQMAAQMGAAAGKQVQKSMERQLE